MQQIIGPTFRKFSKFSSRILYSFLTFVHDTDTQAY